MSVIFGRGRVPSLAAFTVLRSGGLVLLLCAALAPGAAIAQSASAVEPDPAGLAPLTLGAAVERALAGNPGLVAAGFGIDIEIAARDGLALAPPYVASAEIEDVAGGGVLGGVDSAETTLQLSRVLERGGKRPLRSRLGDTRVAFARIEAGIARIDVAADAAGRFIDVVAGQQRVSVAADAVAIAEATLEIVRRRVEVGRSSEADLATAEIELAEANLDRSRFERQLAADRIRLASLWAGDDADFGTASADFFDLPGIEPFEALRRQIDGNPDLLRLVSQERILAAERRLAEARRVADPTVSLGLRHLAQPGEAGLAVSVSVPLGSRSRAGPPIAEAAARQARQERLVEQRRLELAAVLFELRQRAAYARERLTVLSNESLPRGERAVELYRQGFELGSYSLFELNQAQGNLVALRQDALSAAASYHLALVDIEQLLGVTEATENIR